MRSRAEGGRPAPRDAGGASGRAHLARSLEVAARVLALGLIVLVIWRAFTSDAPAGSALRVDEPLRAALPDLTTAVGIPGRREPRVEGPADAPRVHLALRETPVALERDWLVALHRAGTRIEWSDAGIAPPAALAISRAADPAGAVTIAVAARDSVLHIADALGAIDTIAPSSLGARTTTPSVQGTVRVARGDRTLAVAAAPPERVLRPLLVVASAGWEGKFVIAALEERGWTVHTRIRVSPTATVAQGPQLPLDTASYSAILLLDSATTLRTASILEYVRAGGGLVMAGDALDLPGLRAVAPGRPGPAVPGSLLRSASAGGRDGLPLYPLESLRADAIGIDRRDGHIVVAARREGAGRIIVVGETESWRWRMSGADSAPADHRAWWSRIVASVAHAPPRIEPPVDPEAAPYVALIDALGDPVPDMIESGRAPHPPLPWWLGASILALLLAEWVSRRLRGER